jgi:hypothetical protein
MKKYYNFETRFISLRDSLRAFLQDSGVYYELSGAYSYYHFEILVDSAELEKVNAFLDSVTINAVTV